MDKEGNVFVNVEGWTKALGSEILFIMIFFLINCG